MTVDVADGLPQLWRDGKVDMSLVWELAKRRLEDIRLREGDASRGDKSSAHADISEMGRVYQIATRAMEETDNHSALALRNAQDYVDLVAFLEAKYGEEDIPGDVRQTLEKIRQTGQRPEPVCHGTQRSIVERIIIAKAQNRLEGGRSAFERREAFCLAHGKDIAAGLRPRVEELRHAIGEERLSEQGWQTCRNRLWQLMEEECIPIENGGPDGLMEAAHWSPELTAVAREMEELQLLLDAKRGETVPKILSITPLSEGSFQPVLVAISEGGERFVLKPSDAAMERYLREENDGMREKKFKKKFASTTSFLGTALGTYARNLAAGGIEKLLASPHVVASVFAFADSNGDTSIAMEYANGHPADFSKQGRTAIDDQAKGKREELARAGRFQRQATWLQLQDCLSGQLDRHTRNVYHSGERILAFDHDLSFPRLSHRSFAADVPLTLGIRREKRQLERVDGSWGRNYAMPPLIDGEMLLAIRRLSILDLESLYRSVGLTRLEIHPALARAEKMKNLAEKMEKDGRVISTDDWGSESVNAQIDHRYEASPEQCLCPQNCYFVRHTTGSYC
jgi:hypothetical protein